MAEKEITFYNLDGAVGPNCANQRTDVMLVQFFLHQIFSHPKRTASKPAGEKIKISGTFDPTTAAWIRHYQGVVAKRHSVLVDGQVDRARGEQFSKSSISHTHYTIDHMNADHCALFRQEHNHLERHPLIPAELKAEMQQGEPIS